MTDLFNMIVYQNKKDPSIHPRGTPEKDVSDTIWPDFPLPLHNNTPSEMFYRFTIKLYSL